MGGEDAEFEGLDRLEALSHVGQEAWFQVRTGWKHYPTVTGWKHYPTR